MVTQWKNYDMSTGCHGRPDLKPRSMQPLVLNADCGVAWGRHRALVAGAGRNGEEDNVG